MIEWKATVTRYTVDLQSNKLKGTREDVIKILRTKATNIYMEVILTFQIGRTLHFEMIYNFMEFQYLETTSANALLEIDSGLIETLKIRLNDVSINPEPSWFESICKYVYEKIKNEDVFLTNFYRSPAYRKLLLELEFYSNFNVDGEIDSTTATQLLNQCETGSDSNSGDSLFDDDIDFIALDGNGGEFSTLNTGQKVSPKHQMDGNEPFEHHPKPDKCEEKSSDPKETPDKNLLDVIGSGVSKHCRSHSDCTGLIQNIDQIQIEPLMNKESCESPMKARDSNQSKYDTEGSPKHNTLNKSDTHDKVTLICPQHRLSAKIINTAINCEGQYAVYAIMVTIIEDNQQKSWHVYRRYSRFLDLKKLLVKRVCFYYSKTFYSKKIFITFLSLIFSFRRYHKFHSRQRKRSRTLNDRC